MFRLKRSGLGRRKKVDKPIASPAVSFTSKTEVKTTPKIPLPNQDQPPIRAAGTPPKKEIAKEKRFSLAKILENIKSDDLLIIGLLFILITEDIEDDLLVIMLIYILIG